MVESTPDAEASGGAGGTDATEPSTETQPNQPVTMRALLEAGAHFGHQAGRWNPRMKPFIFGDRNGIHIIDLDQTLPRFQDALDFLRETTASGGKVLFVGTKRQAQAAIEAEAVRSGQFYVSRRWLGGMLTNFRTVKKSIDRFKQHLALMEDEEKLAELTKRERSRVSRQIEKYRKSLDGIREMTRLPAAMFVIDVNREQIAVSEARRLGIPIIAIVDTNCDPEGVDMVVPANDDAIRAILLYCTAVADACAEGFALHQDRITSQESERQKTAPEGQKAAPSSGRKVVEITQPPRRGHSAEGSERGGPRRGRGRKEEKAEAAPASAEQAAPAAPSGDAEGGTEEGPSES